MKLRLTILFYLFALVLFSTSCNLPDDTIVVETETPVTPASAIQTSSTLIPSSTPDPFPNPVLAVVGEEETVFDWNNDHCETLNVPDLPSRAFRDANGQVHLIISNITNYRMSGTDLNNLQRDCTPISGSALDPDPALFTDNEWIGSLYTEDGQTVYALIHNEYQGHTHPGKCPQNEYFPCWYNTVTLAVSTDGGGTFVQTFEPPNHLVASLPYPYIAGDGPNGMRNPSNIIRGKDGFYYAFMGGATNKPPDQWVCLMRTDDLSDPKSWRFWDGGKFEGQFINPYEAEGESHKCPALAREQIGHALHDSITYNTYLERYVLVGLSADQINGIETWGVYYSFSDDLIHWTRRKLLLEFSLPWTVANPGSDESHLYPSLLDPNSRSHTFETTGKTAYLYFTRNNFGHGSPDRDLIRVPVEFFPEPGAVALPEPAAAVVTATAEPPNPFAGAPGTWKATDIDGSNLSMTITGLTPDEYTITYQDDDTTVCGKDSSGIQYPADGRGDGKTTTNQLVFGLELTCQTNPQTSPSTFEFTLIYDPGTDTLSDSWGVAWERVDH